MRTHMNRMLSLVLLLGCLSLGIPAKAEGIEDYLGVWVADGAAVEICFEGGERELQCRVVFSDGGDDSDVWTYGSGWYDAQEACLQCPLVVRTHQHYDRLWDMLVETDWSLNDMDFSRFERTEAGIRLISDTLDGPVDFVPLDADAMGARSAALAFLGHWKSESATLRAEDMGAAYLFTVFVPMNGGATGKWTYTCRYDAAEGRMVSVDVSALRVITPTADGGTVEEDTDRIVSQAFFTLEGRNRLLWSDVTDGDGEDMAFERAGD